ncbi:MAG TPA: hypothetical protein VGG74_01505 [Kofleriaceae bacterium]
MPRSIRAIMPAMERQIVLASLLCAACASPEAPATPSTNFLFFGQYGLGSNITSASFGKATATGSHDLIVGFQLASYPGSGAILGLLVVTSEGRTADIPFASSCLLPPCQNLGTPISEGDTAGLQWEVGSTAPELEGGQFFCTTGSGYQCQGNFD